MNLISNLQATMNFDDIFQFSLSIPDYSNGNNNVTTGPHHQQITNNNNNNQIPKDEHYLIQQQQQHLHLLHVQEQEQQKLSQEERQAPAPPQEQQHKSSNFTSLNDRLLKQQEKYLNLQNQLDKPLPNLSIEQECVAPVKTCFDSLEEGKAYLKEYMKAAKIGLVICDSRKGSYTSYRCDRGGHYRDRRNLDDQNRVRKLRTRKCNCQFKLILKANKLDDKWYLIIKNERHNHHLTNLENLPILRRRDSKIKQEIQLLLDSGIKNPTQIQNFLLIKHEDLVITKRDIYNEIGEYTRKHRTETE